MNITAEQFSGIVNKNKFVTGYTLGAARARKNAGGHTHCNIEIVAYALCSQIVVTRKTEFYWCGDIHTATEALNFSPWKLHGVTIENVGTDTLQNIIATHFGAGTENNIAISAATLGAVMRDARRDSRY